MMHEPWMTHESALHSARSGSDVDGARQTWPAERACHDRWYLSWNADTWMG